MSFSRDFYGINNLSRRSGLIKFRVSPMSLDRKRLVLETTFENLSNHLDRLPELNIQEKRDISREWEQVLDKEYQRAKQDHEARDL